MNYYLYDNVFQQTYFALEEMQRQHKTSFLINPACDTVCHVNYIKKYRVPSLMLFGCFPNYSWYRFFSQNKRYICSKFKKKAYIIVNS